MDLSKLINPVSIAIIGVSHEPQKVGYLVAKNLLDQGFKGEVYFINYKYDGKILGRKVYKSLADVKKPIDLAVLAVPADIAINYLDELKQLNIRSSVIYAAGFKETGEDGKKKEEELIKKAKEYGISILGPNCLGFVNTKEKINLTFLKNICPKGNIGFISQSGALGSMLVDYFTSHKNLGFSYLFSIGNKALIDESDLLINLSDDKDTDVIGIYIEDVKDGKKFINALEQTVKKKPVIILKSGSTEEGSKAALSHTGGMVGDDKVYDTIFRQNGAIRANNLTEFITLLKLFSFDQIPFSSTILCLSNAGGVGVLLADDLIKNDLNLMTVSEKTKNAIIKRFADKKGSSSPKITIRNPIDLLGDASAFDYRRVIEETIKEKDIGSVFILLTPQANTQINETAKIIAAIQKKFDRPIYPIFLGEQSVKEMELFFEEHKIAGFLNFDFLPNVLKKIVDYKKYLSTKGRSPSGRKEEVNLSLAKLSLLANEEKIKALTEKKQEKFLNLFESLEVLKLIDVPIAGIFYPKSLMDLRETAKKSGFPLVAKLVSEKITHKTEVGGVMTGIEDYDQMICAYRKIRRIDKDGGCIFQKMIKGFEVFIGAKRDPVFGIMLLIGIGGVMTELYKDVASRIFPFDYQEFLKMTKETRLQKILEGFRGKPRIDPKNLYDILMKIGLLMERNEIIKEIDINPVMVSEKSAIVVDSRIIIVGQGHFS